MSGRGAVITDALLALLIGTLVAYFAAASAAGAGAGTGVKSTQPASALK